MEKFPAINLAKKKRGNVIDSFFRWTLTIGRLIVIITECLALGAFGYRFFLDQQLVDLHDQITRNQAIAHAFKENEAIYRNLQSRLGLIDQFSTSQQHAQTTFMDLTNLVPQDVQLQTISFAPDSFHIEADVLSIASLGNMVQTLSKYSGIASVSIDSIENKTAIGRISISLTAALKKT